MSEITNSFIRNIVSGLKEIPQSVNIAARFALLDYLGVWLAGARIMGDQCDAVYQDLGDSMPTRAMIGGIYAHVVELDDGHRIGMVHPGATVISGLLAVAKKFPVSTDNFLRGIIVGYEVTIRLACAIQPSHKLKFYHATGTCGTVGTAMGIAAMLGFDFEQTKSAISAATTSAAGILEMIDGDTQMKPYNAGRAAMDGVAAAFIGRAKFRCPGDALGGKRGFLSVMTDAPKMQFLTDFTDGEFKIESIYRKPYAACRHCHPSIEAALSIRKMDGFELDKVDRIDVETYRLAVEGHDHTQIEGVNSAKMSIPFSIAVALCTGKAGMEEFSDERVLDSSVLSVAEKVHVSANDELSALCPQKRVAKVTVKTSSVSFSETVVYPKGEPENPMTEDELKSKFIGLASYGGLTEESCYAVIDEVFKETMDLNRIFGLLRCQA